MFEVLGKLGIDLNMLIAQIINFTVLLWILNKFLYKPVIDQVEKNEAELRKAEKDKKVFLEEKENFLREKNETLRQMKKQSQTIIREAKLIAIKLQEEAQEEVKKLKEKLIKQTREQMEKEKKSLTKKNEREKKILMIRDLKENIQQRISSQPELITQLDKAFFELLIRKIESFSREKEEDDNINMIRKNKKLNICLEYAWIPSKIQLKTLQRFFKKEKIQTKENKELIGGFRLEINGLLIESNLLYEITKAYEE